MTNVTPDKQIETLYEVLDSGLIKHWDNAVDGGANRGDWSVAMAEHFAMVHAFEPSIKSYANLLISSYTNKNVIPYRAALWDRPKKVSTHNPPKKPSDRSTFVMEDPEGAIPAWPLDLLLLKRCGLIKLDLEGAEYHALLGAKHTIKRNRPVLIVEVDHQARRYGINDAKVENFITSLGYKLAMHRAPDKVFVWKE